MRLYIWRTADPDLIVWVLNCSICCKCYMHLKKFQPLSTSNRLLTIFSFTRVNSTLALTFISFRHWHETNRCALIFNIQLDSQGLVLSIMQPQVSIKASWGNQRSIRMQSKGSNRPCYATFKGPSDTFFSHIKSINVPSCIGHPYFTSWIKQETFGGMTIVGGVAGWTILKYNGNFIMQICNNSRIAKLVVVTIWLGGHSHDSRFLPVQNSDGSSTSSHII